MWLEYSHETPARPVFAVIGTALALAAAVGVAYFVTVTRVASVVAGVRSLPGWPIEFTLPEGVSWSVDAEDLREGSSPDGIRGLVVYDGRDADQNHSKLIVFFALMPEGTTAAEAFARLTDREPEDARDLTVGPLAGIMTDSGRSRSPRDLSAAACSDEGLAILVKYLATKSDSRSRRVFQAVCRSIQYKVWSVAEPADEFFPPFADETLNPRGLRPGRGS